MANGSLFRPLLSVVRQNLCFDQPRMLCKDLPVQCELSTTLKHQNHVNHPSRPRTCQCQASLPWESRDVPFCDSSLTTKVRPLNNKWVFPLPWLLVILSRQESLDQLKHTVRDVGRNNTSHGKHVQRIYLRRYIFHSHVQWKRPFGWRERPKRRGWHQLSDVFLLLPRPGSPCTRC